MDNQDFPERQSFDIKFSDTGFIYSEKYLEHITGDAHPERPDRLTSIISYLKFEGIWDKLTHYSPDNVDHELLTTLHNEGYIYRLKEACSTGKTYIDDLDCGINEKSYEVALLAAGGVVTAVDRIMSEQISNAFCAVRPPGHHAEKDKAMGFCFFNNVGIGVLHARKYELVRAAVIDWDVHHGNGTQHLFESDPNVLYASLHESPHYPGTGAVNEKGEGDGYGTNFNYPMQRGAGNEEYLNVFKTQIKPEIRKFEPDIIFISAGFDAHRDDPLSSINLTHDAYRDMTMIIRELADEYSGGRIVSVLEGGYNLGSLRRSVREHLLALME